MAVNYARNNASRHAVKEYSAYIYYENGNYTAGNIEIGDEAILDQAGKRGELQLPGITHSDFSNPKSKEKIAVGTVHTHYPLEWAVTGLMAQSGPSANDKNSDLPGIVYDYTNKVYTGAPTNDPKKSIDDLHIWACKVSGLEIKNNTMKKLLLLIFIGSVGMNAYSKNVDLEKLSEKKVTIIK